MIIRKKQEREFWFNAGLNSIPDLAISVAVMLIVDDGFLYFVGTFFGLQAVYFVIWLKNTLWRWARFGLIDKKKLTRRMLDFLTENRFPKPGEYVLDSQSYLSEIVEDEEAETKLRILSAAELGIENYLANAMQTLTLFFITMARDDALEQYNRQHYSG